MNNKYILAFALACMALVTVGCGPKMPYKVVPVSGVVTWQGEPLEGVLLTFYPVDTGGRPSRAVTKEGGSFAAKHTPEVMGIPVGKVRMTVVYSKSGVVPGQKVAIPEKYQTLMDKFGPSTVGYELEITKPEKNLHIELQ